MRQMTIRQTPSQWVQRFATLIPPTSRVLDIACGRGRHSRWLLERGHPVTAVDIDISGVEDLQTQPQVTALQADLETGPWPFRDCRFGGIVMVNYLHRPLFDQLAHSLTPGGVLIVDTFAAGNERFGRPCNPNYLLRPGELYSRFEHELDIVAYEHGFQDNPKPAIRQRLCAVRRRPAHDQMGDAGQ